jgi:hypothetical protein
VNPDEYFLEFPEITFDRERLLDILREYRWDHWQREDLIDGEHNWRQNIKARMLYYEHPYVRELASRFNIRLYSAHSLFVKSPVGFSWHPHRDADCGRQMALVFDLSEDPQPIIWHDDDLNPVVQHTYSPSHPTLIHAQHIHSVPANTKPRVSLFLSNYTDKYETALEKHRAGELILPPGAKQQR